MRGVIGAALTTVGAAGLMFLMVMPAGYAPWGILAAPASAIAVVAGVRMVRA